MSRILFLCIRNGLRSPMAAALAKEAGFSASSAGLSEGDSDPFAAAVLAENGIDLSDHKPRTLEDVAGAPFDHIISLDPAVDERARRFAAAAGAEFHAWPTVDPSEAAGHREMILGAYRAVRDALTDKIRKNLQE